MELHAERFERGELFLGQAQEAGRDERDAHVEQRQHGDQAVDGASVTQVAGEHDVQTVDVADLAPDRVEIEEGLCRMLVGAVAAVDDRDVDELGGKPSRALHWVSDEQQIGVTLDHADRVGEALSFRLARNGRFREADALAAEATDRTLEGESSSRRRFEEEGRDDVSGERATVPFLEPIRRREKKQNLLPLEISDGYDVSTNEILGCDHVERKP